jgi:small redox-active disulfide protein 2
MSAREEIWVIGTDPPCPRCDRLGQMAHEVANDLNLPVMIRHLAYTDDDARQFAGSLGLEPGTAKDVAKKAGIAMDWEEVYRILDGSGETNVEPSDPTCCPTTPSAKWTPALDLALRPCEEKALSVGVMMTPVLVIGGRVYHQGSVPSREQLRKWMEEAFKRENQEEGKTITVEVLGPGCHNCETVYQNVFKALNMASLRDRVHVKKISDLNYFMEKGVYVTPGLVIDGRVVSKGKVLRPEQILEMLEKEITA